jgi:hypothetical protein
LEACADILGCTSPIHLCRFDVKAAKHRDKMMRGKRDRSMKILGLR